MDKGVSAREAEMLEVLVDLIAWKDNSGHLDSGAWVRAKLLLQKIKSNETKAR